MPWCQPTPVMRAHYIEPKKRRYICGIRWVSTDKIIRGKPPEGLEPCLMCKKLKDRETIEAK